jgi:2-isopropylmalate synthase
MNSNTKRDDKRVVIFDTTLRDGQQCPGAGMSYERNLEYARLAADLGVDILEAGFPSASRVDFEIVRAIAAELAPKNFSTKVAALCQLRDEQIDRTIEALEPGVKYNKSVLHVYVPVDPILMEASLGERAKDKNGIARDVHDFIKRAVDSGMEVEFSPEGYSRMASNFNFVTDLIRAAVQAGVTTINCPDTIGGACKYQGPEYFVEKMKEHAAIVRKEFPQSSVIWSVHCHNDFGLAVENSINGVFRGPARQVEGCFNGIGERAGNAALEQVIMIIKQFAACVDPERPVFTGIQTEKLKKVCDFVSKHMLVCQPHWPISGANAMRHSSGGHTNAVLKNPTVYQPFDPADVGAEVSLIFGPLSGGNHAKSIILEAGYKCDDSEKAEAAQFIKELYKDRRKGITDEELLKGYLEFRKPIRTENFDYSRSSNRSEIRLEGKFFDVEGETKESHEGKDSALAALKKAIDRKFGRFNIQSHKSTSDGEGIDAKSISTIVIVDDRGDIYQGIGDDQDIEIAAMKALIAAVNTAYIEREFKIR